jgi:hypothetical protein
MSSEKEAGRPTKVITDKEIGLFIQSTLATRLLWTLGIVEEIASDGRASIADALVDFHLLVFDALPRRFFSDRSQPTPAQSSPDRKAAAVSAVVRYVSPS